jgi:uncharacterized protein YeaO (DUF488 family)
MFGPRDVRVRRVYDRRNRSETGYRVLVDRLWPRGLSKTDAALDAWIKDVAPSTELRRWYDHDEQRFEAFARRYRAELRRPPASVELGHLIELASSEPVMLLTATRDVEHSAAWVLQQCLTRQAARSRKGVQAPDRLARNRGDDGGRHDDESSATAPRRGLYAGAVPR